MANLDLKATLELIDKMSAPLKAISSQASKMQKDISNSTKELQKMQSTLNKANNLSGLTDKLRQVQQEIKKVAAEEKALQRAISASGSPTKAQSRELAKLSASLVRLQATQAKYRNDMSGLGSSIKEAGYSTKNLANTQAELAAKMNTATAAITKQRTQLAQLQKSQKSAQNLKDLGDKMQGGGMRAATAGAGALYGLSKPINEAKHFQTETARVASLGLGEASTKDAVEFAKNMKTYGTSITDNLTLVRDGMTAFADEHHAQMVAPMLAKMKFANEAMFGEGQGHENEKKLMDMLKVIEVRGGTKSEAAFSEQANLIQQVITATGGRVQSDQWMDAIKTGGIAAKQMDNKAFYQTLEPLVQEMGGGSVGNGLMSAYQNLYQGRTTKRAAMNLDKLGLIGDKSKVKYDKVGQTAQLDIGALKGADLFKKNQFDWMEKVLIPQLNEHGMTSDTQIIDAIGSIFTNRKAADLMANMYMQRDQIHKSQKFNAGADNIDQLNEKAQGTAAGKELEAKAKMHDAYLQLGTAVLPTYTAAIEAATSAMQGMATIMEKYPTLTKAIAIGLAAIAAAFVVFGGLAVVIGSVLGPLAMLKIAISTLGGMSGIITGLSTAFTALRTVITGLSIASALNPIGLAIMGIAVLALLLIQYWEPVKAFFTGLWEGISAGLSPALESLKSAFEPLGGILSSLGEEFSNLLTPLQFTSEELTTVQAIGFGVGMAIAAVISSFISAGEAIGTFAGAVVVYGGQAVDYVSTLPSRMIAFLSGLPAQMTAMGSQIMEGLKNGILSTAESVIGAISNVASRIKSAFTGAMDIHSPSRVFASYGDFMMQGLHQGLVANDSPVQAVVRTSDNIRSAMDTSAIRFDSRPPIRSGMAGAGTNTAPAPITINVYASAGQSVKDIARQVVSELARTGQAQTANNTALYDLPEQWG